MERVIQVEVYERDLRDLSEVIPSRDPFKEKFRVLLTLLKGFEDKIGDKSL